MKKGQMKNDAQPHEAVRMHGIYSSFESMLSLERYRVQFSPSFVNFPRDVVVLWLLLGTWTLTDETLGNMYYSFDVLSCCVVGGLFFSVVGFFVSTH